MSKQTTPSDNSNSLNVQLGQTLEHLEFALKSAQMGTWDINLETGTVSCSKQMLDLWGVSTEQFQGERSILQSKVHPDDLQKMNELIDTAIANKTIYEMEYRIIPSPGTERWILSRGRCAYGRLSGVVLDITDRKEKEKALSDALNSRDHFLKLAGHELRSPLTCLQLQIQVMNWELKNNHPEIFKNERIGSGFKKQLIQLNRINRLVENMLDISRISENSLSIEPTEFNLYELVTHVLESFNEIAKAQNVEITLTSPLKINIVWDWQRLEQVFLNLLLNALHFGEKKPIHVKIQQEGQNVLLKVIDQGKGISPEDQKKIFNRCEGRLPDEKIKGLGLGLYISNSIVKAHGGELRIESAVGKGSEFCLSFFPKGQL